MKCIMKKNYSEPRPCKCLTVSMLCTLMTREVYFCVIVVIVAMYEGDQQHLNTSVFVSQRLLEI